MAHMFASLSKMETDEDMVNAAKAVIEHHFNNHQCCGEWCRRKNVDPEKDNKKKYYRCKDKDAKLHSELQARIERFIAIEALREVAHGMNTLMNESFNNTVSWVAPKNKVYSLSDSLQNRIALALGINGLGTLNYYKLLCGRCNIEIPPDVLCYLTQQSNDRDVRNAKAKRPESKQKRVQKCHDNLLVKTVIAKRERALREGSYQSLRGLDGVYTENELELAKKMWPGRSKKKAANNGNNKRVRKDPATLTCETCKATGHAMVTSRLCKHHEAWKVWRATNPKKGSKFVPPAEDSTDDAADDDDGLGADAAEIELDEDSSELQLRRDAEECDKLDSMELDGNDSDLECFYDAMECSEDF